MPALQNSMTFRLLAKAKAFDQCLVLLYLGSFQVIQQFAAFADHSQQTTAGMVILAVRLEMFGQIRDACGQQRDLDFGRTRVTLGTLKVLQNLRLMGSGYSHVLSPTKKRVILLRNYRITQAV